MFAAPQTAPATHAGALGGLGEVTLALLLVLGGCVTMDSQDALDAGDKSKNVILMCQAHATGHVAVDA